MRREISTGQKGGRVVDLKKGWLILVLGGLAVWLAACSGQAPKNLGVKDGGLAACPSSPNCVSSRAPDKRHFIAPFTFSGAPQKAFARLRKVLADRRDTTIVKETPNYLRVEFRTTFFTDDGEFLLDGDRIEVRSASRVGYYDFGKNRSRLEEIRRAFSKPSVHQ